MGFNLQVHAYIPLETGGISWSPLHSWLNNNQLRSYIRNYQDSLSESRGQGESSKQGLNGPENHTREYQN